MRQIGSKLKELRIEKNMKQKELADAAGVSVFTAYCHTVVKSP